MPASEVCRVPVTTNRHRMTAPGQGVRRYRFAELAERTSDTARSLRSEHRTQRGARGASMRHSRDPPPRNEDRVYLRLRGATDKLGGHMNGRLVGVMLMAGVVTGLVTACSATSSGNDSAQAAAPVEAGTADASGAGGSKSTGQQSGSTAGDVEQPGLDRSLVRTATIEMRAGDVAATVEGATDIAVTEGGY